MGIFDKLFGRRPEAAPSPESPEPPVTLEPAADNVPVDEAFAPEIPAVEEPPTEVPDLVEDTTPSPEVPDEAATPGWDAIREACERIYPDQLDPLHYATIIKYALGGNDPIDGVSIYRVKEPRPHWHYVSFGFSDLYGDQDGPDQDGESGYGFELTFRLADDEALTSEHAPVWPISLMQNLARYVFSTGNTFDAGHHLDANGPIEADGNTRLSAIGFVVDPALGIIDTPSGQVKFLQMLGLTGDDLADAKAWHSTKLYELLMSVYPLGITDMNRDSLNADEEIAAKIAAGKETDGSGLGYVYTDVLDITETDGEVQVTLGALTMTQLGDMLRYRLPHGLPFRLAGPDQMLIFEPGEETSVVVENDTATLILTADDLTWFRATVKPEAGDYVDPSGVRWHIEQTKITNAAGEVVETVG